MKNECSIVRDLLPLYAEGMLSEDSAAFVKEHLDTCEECRALSAGEEPSAPTDADTEQRTGEAGVLRTLKKKLRKQTWCAIFITAAVVLLVAGLQRFKGAQLMGNGRLRHVQYLRQITDAHLRTKQYIQYLNPGSISENLKKIGEIIQVVFSRHSVIYFFHDILMYMDIFTAFGVFVTSLHRKNPPFLLPFIIHSNI